MLCLYVLSVSWQRIEIISQIFAYPNEDFFTILWHVKMFVEREVILICAQERT